MPVIQLKSNCNLTNHEKEELMVDIQNKLACLLHKEIKNLMVTFSEETMLINGTFDPAFYADIHYVSPDSEVKDKDYICNEVLNIICKHTNVSPERVMIFIGTVSTKNAWKYTPSTK